MFLLKFLLFKLMFMSGVVKLTSGDNCWGWINHSFHWSALTALDYHYWTQPLPTVFAWFADKHPEWFKKFSVAFCLVVEIIVPFFIWAPRRPRLIAAGLLIFLQLAIAITGNYCFFNLLTIALCLLLIDDASLRRASPTYAPVAASLREVRVLRIAKRLQIENFSAAVGRKIGSRISWSACWKTSRRSRDYSYAIPFPIDPRDTSVRFCLSISSLLPTNAELPVHGGNGAK